MAELRNLTFDRWVKHIFDHPEPDNMPLWYFRDDADIWNGLVVPDVTVSYLTRLFENIRQIAKPYTDAQLNQGLWFVASNGCSDFMFALNDERVPLAERLRCVESIYTLYETLFAPRCTPILSHRLRGLPDDPAHNALNSVCYMWWDLTPIGGPTDDPEFTVFNAACLDVMRRTLMLDSIACQEGALHGLGHWSYYEPHRAQISSIIDQFLAANPNIDSQLKTYALSAKSGCVL